MVNKKRKVNTQSGALPFHISKTEGLRVMLITTRKMNRWIIPKGNIEKNAPKQSAVNEAYEEAGIKGKIQEKTGSFKYDKSGEIYEVQVYLFKITKILRKWPEARYRLRRLVSVEQALSLISDEAVGKMLKKLLKRSADIE
ncbi:MAG: hypothetical protein A2017_22280 [Lentisphaerae bacterium GWF2_44_16]|nr:MAG: hypothetical protein A2017_22280 [Lentisphaerae bacterium GWF2_44_16]